MYRITPKKARDSKIEADGNAAPSAPARPRDRSDGGTEEKPRSRDRAQQAICRASKEAQLSILDSVQPRPFTLLACSWPEPIRHGLGDGSPRQLGIQ